ncbi:SET domain-containing protein [Candidatus Nomurabacteria bacterium]|nr:SET domain-containing protein [Candidatus Nomurabacteria bacterium]
MDITNEFSFVLKPSQHGIGVFAVHKILKDTHLRLFGDNETLDLRSIARPKENVPNPFHSYCMERKGALICPEDFGRMHVGWYLNHSKNPNTRRDEDFKWYSSRDIEAGEEVLIDYNSLEEPDEAKEDYYKS